MKRRTRALLLANLLAFLVTAVTVLAQTEYTIELLPSSIEAAIEAIHKVPILLPLSSSIKAVVEILSNEAPNAPTLDGPAEGERFNPSANVTFTWTFSDPDSGDSQSAYRLQLDDDSDFSSPIIDTGKVDSASSNTTQTLPSNVGLYYWRVKTWDSSGEEGPYSNGRAIIVDGLKVDSYSIDMASGKVYVRMVYAYDGSPVENGAISFAGLSESTNSTGWAVFDLSSAADFGWGQVAYGVQDGVYGITCKVQNQTLPLAKRNRLVQSGCEISSLTYDSDEDRLYVEFAGTGAYTLKVHGSKPTYILNATYDLEMNYTDHLALSHDGSRRIVLGYPNWGDFYVRGLTAGVIAEIYWTDQKLTIVLDGPSGTSGTLYVHCGSQGMPNSWSGFSNNPTYDAGTTVLTGEYTFSSSLTITLDFTTSTTSGAGGGASGAFTPEIYVRISSRRVSLYPGESATLRLIINWTGVNSIRITSIEFMGAAEDWLTLAEDLPKTIFKPIGEEVGTGEIELHIMAPETAQPGDYTVPVTIRAEAVGSRIDTNGYLTFSILRKPTPISLIPEYMTWIFVAAIISLILYAYLKD